MTFDDSEKLAPRRQHQRTDWNDHYQNQARRALKANRRIAALLEGCSPGNRLHLEKFIKWKKRQKRSVRTIENQVDALAGLDLSSQGTPWEDLTPELVERWLDEKTGKTSQGTIRNQAGYLRHFLRWFHDSDGLPPGFKRATALGRPEKLGGREEIPQTHLDALFEHFEDDTMMLCFVRLLTEAGHRIEEILSLNVGSWESDDEHGGTLRLPPEKDARFHLKTGPRPCYIVDCAGILKAWLSMHPFPGDPEAPLFVTKARNQHGRWWQPLGPNNARDRLKTAWEYLDLPNWTPHYFRHTAATHKARKGWTVGEAAPFFGWTKNSRMWGHYTHLNDQDVRERIRRDAGIDKTGNRLPGDLDDKAMDKMLKSALKRLLMEDSP